MEKRKALKDLKNYTRMEKRNETQINHASMNTSIQSAIPFTKQEKTNRKSIQSLFPSRLTAQDHH
jgi:hypothetical protein